MGHLYWLSDEARAAIEPHLPRNQPGARRVDDRRLISGIPHVLKMGCRWRDCPKEYGPHTTIYSRFNRWSLRRLWLRILKALVAQGVLVHSTVIDSTYNQGTPLRLRRKRGPRRRPAALSRGGQTTKNHALTDLLGRPAIIRLTADNVSDIKAADEVLAGARPLSRLIADKGYDADRLRSRLKAAGSRPIIPGRRNRKRVIQYDVQRYRERWRIEAAFCRLKDFRRVATRYDKLAANFLSAVALATAF